MSKNTRQGNRAGRSAVIEAKSAALSGEFGMKMLTAKFPELAEEILAKLGTYSRGPRKGQPRGYIHWEKVIEGGFDYRNDRRCVVYPGTQDWRVLDSADAYNGKNVAAEISHEKMKAKQAAEDAAWDAMTERQKWAFKAKRARASAHRDRIDGDMYDFHYNMQRARGYIEKARNA